MIEKDVIVRRLTALKEYISDLSKAEDEYTYEEFCSSKVKRRYVERTLHMAIEACLDIANHIIPYEGFREPETNKDCFQILYEQGILPVELTENLKKIAQFRNIIVHDYIRIKPEIVYAIL